MIPCQRQHLNRFGRSRGAPRWRALRARYLLAASADREIGLQLLNFCLIAQRLFRRWSLGNVGLLPDLGLFWASCNERRLACLLAIVDTYCKAIGTGLLRRRQLARARLGQNVYSRRCQNVAGCRCRRVFVIGRGWRVLGGCGSCRTFGGRCWRWNVIGRHWSRSVFGGRWRRTLGGRRWRRGEDNGRRIHRDFWRHCRRRRRTFGCRRVAAQTETAPLAGSRCWRTLLGHQRWRGQRGLTSSAAVQPKTSKQQTDGK